MRFAMLLKRLPLAALCCAALSACQTIAPPAVVDVAQPSSVKPEPVHAPAINNGSIFQAAQYRPLFEDHRARLVGDTITVQIVEKLSATQTSTSSVAKTGNVTAGVTALPGLKPNSFTNGRTSIGLNSANTMDGKGSTVNSNDFSGTITATVIEVLANGHLVISGEKQIGVNANVDVLRFSGQIDPHSIQTGNLVASQQIANVRIQQKGRGAQADAQEIGWLGRFFLNVLPI